MPPEGFFSGDSGVKLIAARNAIAHPARPFDIDLPRIGARRVPYVDTLFAVHGAHAHPIQSPTFPIVSAPLIALFGLRGAYLLPIASFLALLPLLNVLRRHAAPDVPAGILAAFSLLASPVFFYALEFWEHAPAVACLAGSMALVLSRRGRNMAMACAGALASVAVLLRPEAIFLVLVLVMVTVRGRVVPFALGGIAAAAPLVAFNLFHFGNLTGPHIATSLGPLFAGWLTGRADRVVLWLVPTAPLAVAGLAAVAVGWLLYVGLAPRSGAVEVGRVARSGPGVPQLVALAGALALALSGALGQLPRESVWNAWPAAVLLLVPFAGTGQTRQLWMIGLVTVAAIAAASAHDGGAQWGPRFLLVAVPPLMLLVACAAARATGPGQARRLRQALVLLVLACGLWTTRAAYRELRSTKNYYARVVGAVQAVTQPGGYIVTNVWWLDQIAAALYPTRTFLYGENSVAAAQIVQEVAGAGAPAITLAWTRDGEPLNGVPMSCRVTTTREIEERALTFAAVQCN